ncbi:MAG: hypothetical protein CM1200mP23_3130 [Nitrososphaerota archaeon]|nr:MAG: hypothetical protein CM1200mP23_3130 [Nitrososphaerota archaeon]
MFCSDGLGPIDLTKFGHIDHCVRESVKAGLNQVEQYLWHQKTVLIIITWAKI